MLLTDTKIRAFKHREIGAKPKRERDGRGLALLIMPKPAASKLWRFRYQFEGREKEISLGAYPDVPLEKARQRREAARQLVADGKDPSADRQAKKVSRVHTLRAVAEALQEGLTQKPRTILLAKRRLEKWIYKRLGDRPIRSITSAEILEALRVIERMGHRAVPRQVLKDLNRIFRYAAASGYVDRNVCEDLKGALNPSKVIPHARETNPERLGEMLLTMQTYRGQPVTVIALNLLPHVFLRPVEERQAPWSEIDFERAEWRIPAERMKMEHEHVIPLSRQVLALLRELQMHSGPDGLMFPGMVNRSRPLSENTVNVALRRLGIPPEQQCGHGFRGTAATVLGEMDFDEKLIDLQLAHRNGPYHGAVKLPQRRVMMQRWSDHIDAMRAGAASRKAIRAVK
jgi:integrase